MHILQPPAAHSLKRFAVNLSDVDSITHALLVATLLAAAGAQEFIVFGILGAVILDADVLFTLVSGNRPSLYMYIHGGAAHSIVGSTVMAIAAYSTFFIVWVSAVAAFQVQVVFQFGIAAILCTIAGAWVHIALDYLATPGIPVFWPRSERKYTAGIFAGPSFFMIVVSWTFLILLIPGIIPLSLLWIYGALFLVFLCARSTIRMIAFVRLPRHTYPTFNPLHWMVIRNDGGCWSAGFFLITGGVFGEAKTYSEYTGVTEGDMKEIEFIPEVRRVRYHSYFTVAERNGESITIRDPMREDGTIRYPPYYVKVTVRNNGSISDS
jgi:inner membrane protein